MRVDEKMTELICKLEYIIGEQTYNPNSYNGWTGEEGCSYKYPVSYCENKKALKERAITKGMHIYNIAPDCVNTIKYVFGSNHLYIGDGIVKLLEFLEKRYDIDFYKLESELIEQNKAEAERVLKERRKKMETIKKELEEGNVVTMSPGRWHVGIDIPEGRYFLQRGRIYCLDLVIQKKSGIDKAEYSTKKQISATLKKGDTLSTSMEVGLKLRE